MLISNSFKISYIKIWIFALFLNLLKHANSSSVESCLSAYSINLSNKFDPNSVLPIDCQCSNTDLVCLNLRIYDSNPTDSQLAFPTLNILFTKYNDSINYILPKTRFSFFGYKKLIPNAFRGVKFVDLNNTNICNQSIYIDFLETTYFPGGVFDRFGNLENVTGNNRPKLFLTVRNEEFLAIQNNFTLETNSFAGINIEKLSIKYPLPLNAINSNAFLNSVINTLEIKQATGFTSFTETLDYPRITVKNLIIDECYNFVFNDKSIPTFEGLNSLSIKTSGVKQIPLNIWNNYKYLKSLRITGNQLTNIDQTSFKGLENSLETLDLSNNSITSIDWTAFRNFSSLKSFDFSNNLFSLVQSPSRLWPNPNGVEVISLKGYTFDNSSICQFKKESDTSIINLFKTFIELDSSHACNCFVFFIYKDYRTLSATNILNQNNLMNKTPQCYQRIYAQSQNFIQIAEDSCNFSFACNAQTTTPSSVTTPCYSTISTTPGLTTITIGNQTTVTTKAPITITSPAITTKTETTPRITTPSTTSINEQTTSLQTIFSTITDCFSTSNNRQNTTQRNTTNELNTPTIIVIAVLVALAFLLLLIILGLIIYFKTRIFKSDRESIIKPKNQLPTRTYML